MLPLKLLCFIALCSPPLLAQQQAPKPNVPQTRLFGIILIQGLTAPAPDSEPLPQKTKQVLDEVADFLPYKHFKMLDSSFIRSNGHATFNLVGPDQQALIANLRIQDHPEKTDTIQVKAFQIIEETLRFDGEKQYPAVNEYLNTSFSIKADETIVVGTSRIGKKDSAVIILFSAG